jgi:hypothetical protein
MVSEEKRKVRFLTKILLILLTSTIFFTCQPAIAGKNNSLAQRAALFKTLLDPLINFITKPFKTPIVPRTGEFSKSMSSIPTKSPKPIKILSPTLRKDTISSAQKLVRKHSQDAALKLLKSEANDKTFKAVHKVALEAAYKNNHYKMSEIELNRIAMLSALSAMKMHEKEQGKSK